MKPLHWADEFFNSDFKKLLFYQWFKLTETTLCAFLHWNISVCDAGDLVSNSSLMPKIIENL